MFNKKRIPKIRIIIAILIGFGVSGCSSTSELIKQTSSDKTVDTDYSIIYYIHADSDYLYHDSNGNPVLGNSQILNTAHKVAENAKSGEVFIFYQQPVKKFLGLFPRKTSHLYYYSKGELSNVVLYRHANKNENFLTTEAQLFFQYGNQFQYDQQKLQFLYFGHEIPLNDGKKYHLTLPEIDVNIESFSNGIAKFLTGEGQRFDLVVLSTCNNGSPAMANSLLPITDTLLASPQNLHLSHIDTGSLNDLESDSEISSNQIAQSMAEQTYNRLDSEILTTITLAVYDFKTIKDYREDLERFIVSYEQLDPISYYSDNIDCNRVDFFDNELFRAGVNSWYKPARFGRRSLTDGHSGWGCRPFIEE